MFSYSTFTFSVFITIAQQQDLSFDSLWILSYGLNFGSYAIPTTFNAEYVIYFGATIVNVILMLNLLISILGDTFDQFQIEKSIIDYKEKAKLIIEVQKIISLIEKKPELRYLHVCSSPFSNEDTDNWEGKILFAEKKTDKNIQLLKIGQKDIQEEIKDVNRKIKKNSKSIENRIECKLEAIEHKFSLKVEGVENNMKNKMNELDQKIELLISLVNKKS